MMVKISTAILSLVPGAKFSVTDNDYSTIEWASEGLTKPTEAEVNAEIARLEADYIAKQYQRDRAKAYPSLQAQLDMQYWDSVNGTTTWADAIAAVKAQFPKPTE
jgi:hypothetical protein